jgi:hypothetical protein
MSYAEELSRLRQIAWERTGTSCEEQHIELVKDFLANCGRLLQRYDTVSTDPLITPATLFGDRFKTEATVDLEMKKVASAAPNPLVRWAAQRHLAFCVAADAGLGDASELLNLYSPLVQLFDRGGSLDKHHHELIISERFAISTVNWQQRFSTIPTA